MIRQIFKGRREQPARRRRRSPSPRPPSAGWTRPPGPGRSIAPTTTARSSRAPTTRATRSPRASCPPELRPHLIALYAFARSADDFADEPEYEGRRDEALDRWEEELQPLLLRRGRPPGLHRPGRHHREARPARSPRSRTCWRRSGWTWRSGATPPSSAARLHRPLGRAGRAPAAGAVRLPRSRAGALRRRDLHGAAADQLLAGRRRRRRPRPHLPPGRGPALLRRHRGRPQGAQADPAAARSAALPGSPAPAPSTSAAARCWRSWATTCAWSWR